MQPVVRAARLSPRPKPSRHSLLFALAANGLALVTLLVVLFNAEPSSPALHTGQIASQTVVAQRKATYLDQIATTAKRRQAAAAVPARYKIDATAAQQQQREAAAFLTQIAPAMTDSESIGTKLAAIRAHLPGSSRNSDLQQLAYLSPQDFRATSQISLSLLAQATKWQFDANQVANTANGLLGTVGNKENEQQRDSTLSVLDAFLRPTSIPDFQATLALQTAASNRVVPVTNTVNAGEIVVERGQMITPAIMEKLVALGLQTHEAGWQDIVGSALFAGVIIAMLFWYLHAIASSTLTNARLMMLVDFSLLATVAGARIFSVGHVLLPYFLPVAALATFAAVLMSVEACVAMTLSLALLAGWIVGNSFELALYYFVSSAAGILAVRHVRRVKQFVVAGMYIMVFAFATSLAFLVVDRAYDVNTIEQHALAAIFNGFASSALALGGFTVLSQFFGVTTSLQLLELGQPNHPLLRRLSLNAPGTYNHSVVLGTMVERAAEDIGADSLAARVGALFHDVGKTVNAECFVENQLGIANVHDELEPEESARIIRGHVTQGLRLAKQYRLPPVLQDAIAEHHGTTQISFFLHKAREAEPDGAVDLALFRYPGPKPHSRETALIMLGDGCESAVRASSDHSQTRIDEVVAHIFQERIKQGQLDECPLTLRDLERARVAFCSVLNGLYHPRIEYPEAVDMVQGLAAPNAAGDVPAGESI